MTSVRSRFPAKAKPLARRLAELDMQACAITDYGNMYGAVSFYNTLKYSGFRPILGYEAFVAPGSQSPYTRSTAPRSLRAR